MTSVWKQHLRYVMRGYLKVSVTELFVVRAQQLPLSNKGI